MFTRRTNAGHPGRLVMSTRKRLSPNRKFLLLTEPPTSLLVSGLRGCRPGPCTLPKRQAAASGKAGRKPADIICRAKFSPYRTTSPKHRRANLTTTTKSAIADSAVVFRSVGVPSANRFNVKRKSLHSRSVYTFRACLLTRDPRKRHRQRKHFEIAGDV